MTESQKPTCADCGADLDVTPTAVEVVCGACGTLQSIEENVGFSEVVENSPAQHRVIDVFRYLVSHPIEMLILRWNWKAAVLSAFLRAPIFFFTYFFKKDGLKIAIGAALAQSVFRFIFGGVNGAIIQSFSKVEPAWHAVLTVPLVLAAFSHVVEFFVQTLYDNQTGVNSKKSALTVSIIISIISAVFNLFAMRRGALLVRDESKQSLWRDLKRMPWIVFEFISFPLIWTVRKAKRD